MNKDLLDLYTDYLISQNGHATATGLSALLGGDISHDKVTRFFRRSDYTSKDLWEYNKGSPLKIKSLLTTCLLITGFLLEIICFFYTLI